MKLPCRRQSKNQVKQGAKINECVPATHWLRHISQFDLNKGATLRLSVSCVLESVSVTLSLPNHSAMFSKNHPRESYLSRNIHFVNFAVRACSNICNSSWILTPRLVNVAVRACSNICNSSWILTPDLVNFAVRAHSNIHDSSWKICVTSQL